MSFSALVNSRFRVPSFCAILLFFSLVALAQATLKYRLLTTYQLKSDAPTNKSKPTLFALEDEESFREVFETATTAKRPEAVNFAKETVIGIATPATTRPPKLSVSRVFVQDSVLTIRYIRLKDTTLTDNPQSAASQPLLLLTIPKQTVLKTRLVENGRVVQVVTKKQDEE